MTIHTEHPFADATPDPVRRLRGHLGGVVTLLTAGAGLDRAGLTVTSLLVAAGDTARVVALVDPDSSLADAVQATGRAVVALLGWPDRALAEIFAGAAPAPGGAFRQADFEDTPWGPRLVGDRSWAGLALESVSEVGWSAQLTMVVEEIGVGEDRDPLLHHRGRLRRIDP